MGAPGKDILTAYVIGFELAVCLYEPLWGATISAGGTVRIVWQFGGRGGSSPAAKLQYQSGKENPWHCSLSSRWIEAKFRTMTSPFTPDRLREWYSGSSLGPGGFDGLMRSIIESPFGFAKVFGQDSEVDWKRSVRPGENL